MRLGGLQQVVRGQQRHRVSFLLPRRVLNVGLGMTSDQQAWHRDCGCHAGHSGQDGRQAPAGCAE